MPNVKPCNEQNAIKVIAFAFEFQEEIEESLIHELILLYQNTDELNKSFPRKELLHSMTVQISEHGQQTQNQKLSGITFDRLMPNGTQELAISIRNNSVVISCGKYTRWNEIWEKAKSYFKIILPVLSDKTLTLVGFECIDEFIITDISNWKDELFNSSSKYIPSNISELVDLWHSHHGFLINDNEPVEHKTLNNINVNYISETGASSINKILIRTQHQSRLKLPVKYNADFFENIADKIMNKNHNFNKELMMDLLSDDMCNRIKLEHNNA